MYDDIKSIDIMEIYVSNIIFILILLLLLLMVFHNFKF